MLGLSTFCALAMQLKAHSYSASTICDSCPELLAQVSALILASDAYGGELLKKHSQMTGLCHGYANYAVLFPRGALQH